MMHRVLEKNNKITEHNKPLNHVHIILLANHEFDLHKWYLEERHDFCLEEVKNGIEKKPEQTKENNISKLKN
ncbi:hypothetical protein H5410_010762 [Solanum commersonii]|uniref:Uncharacterized protein n=1 Tax=Solanum commersonii TaxID=4109 RepID=A0A9J6ALL6_SOLCO|nr:hypothetical protein H5410_010762 [Solanum commersonii]